MKLYSDKTRARYAAKRELAKGNLNAEPKEGVDFLVVEEGGKFGWRPLEMRAPAGPDHGDEAQPADGNGRRSRTAQIEEALFVASAEREEEKRAEKAPKPKRNVRVLAPVEKRPNVAVGDDAEALAAETAPEWPTSFVPDVENGEIASREYGMLLTRERAVDAAHAAGATDAVITQTGRGMFVWRTSQLDKVWKANNVPQSDKRERPARVANGPRAPRERKQLAPGEHRQSNSPYRSNCIKAARRALGDGAKEGVDFAIEPKGQFWVFVPLVSNAA